MYLYRDFKTLLNHFSEDRAEADHIHFLYNLFKPIGLTIIAAKIKSITAREIFTKVPSVKEDIWGGEFWTDRYCVSTVSEHADEDVVRNYVRNHGCTIKQRQPGAS